MIMGWEKGKGGEKKRERNRLPHLKYLALTLIWTIAVSTHEKVFPLSVIPNFPNIFTVR